MRVAGKLENSCLGKVGEKNERTKTIFSVIKALELAEAKTATKNS